MKYITCLFVTVVLTSLAIDLMQPSAFVLAWTDNSGGATEVFKVYQSPSLGIPTTNWTLLTTVVGTATNVIITMTPGKMFFFVTASNFWGESGPSNITNTPPIPGVTNVGLHR